MQNYILSGDGECSTGTAARVQRDIEAATKEE
jgi:hypothetical protein